MNQLSSAAFGRAVASRHLEMMASCSEYFDCMQTNDSRIDHKSTHAQVSDQGDLSQAVKNLSEAGSQLCS